MVKSTFKNLSLEKKERVEKALLKEFSTYPLLQAQVARIVKDAHIARGAFYKYFDDLEDAYLYIYHQAIKDIHLNYRNLLSEFDPGIFYKMTVDFIMKADQSPYRNLIRLHICKNEDLVQTHPTKRNLMNLDVQNWSAMILTHEVIKAALFDPEHRQEILDKYQQSLNLLKGR